MNNLDNESLENTSFYFLEPDVKVTSVNSVWTKADCLGAVKMRTTLSRNSYVVTPGLYSIGKPNRDSEVLVSANYKLSFDILRRSLIGITAWILVLDTKGINVWCAAGKGSFGTKELINRINLTGIINRINHKRIILPQLGAPGIAAHEVKTATGLNVKYGPVRAEDLPQFISSGLKATQEMRRVKFNFIDRLILVPVEIVYGSKYLLYALIFLLAISGFDKLNFSIENLISTGIRNSILIILAFISGTIIGPLFLPLLPFRSFSLKGAVAGVLMWIISFVTILDSEISLIALVFLFVFLAVSSFFTMNFTGASTYTSLSGVKKEMKYAVPAQISMSVISVLLLIISIFI